MRFVSRTLATRRNDDAREEGQDRRFGEAKGPQFRLEAGFGKGEKPPLFRRTAEGPMNARESGNSERKL